MMYARIISIRRHGKIAFAKIDWIENYNKIGTNQLVFLKQTLQDKYEEALQCIKVGAIIAFDGSDYTTSTGVYSIDVKDVNAIFSPEVGFPSEHFGIENEELKRRHRFLDCIYNKQVREKFVKRSQIIRSIRDYFNNKNFIEFETPILSPKASGAMARPFETYYNALDSQFFMRIAPETYLKRILASGFSDVFEIGKNFRNEGVDNSHLQEFTAIEWYSAFKDYLDNLKVFLDLLDSILRHNSKKVEYQGNILDFSKIAVLTFKELFEKYAPDYDPFAQNAKEKETDKIFKAKIRPNIVQPTIVIDYPSYVSPMAKRSEKDPAICEQWQFIVNGWEIAKCYSELVDAKEQKDLLQEQVKQKNSGDLDTMDLEEDFLTTMEYGIPPCSGVGIGIDRLVAILTNTSSLRDVVFFPPIL